MDVSIETLPIAGIGLAILSAAVLALGNLFQARGVGAVSSAGDTALGGRQIGRLLRNRVWLLGSLFLGVAILLQLLSLTVAQLIVVQPVGVTALVFAALLTALTTRKAPSRQVVRAIVICIVGVGAFVTVAALVAEQKTIGEAQLIAVLLTLLGVLILLGLVFLFFRGKVVPPIVFVMAGGALTGFVATLGKTVILRVQSAFAAATEGDLHFDSAIALTIVCVVAIIVAGGLSIYFVQTSHVVASPELVVAGLTVIDPFVAVILGITILGEAAGAPLWSIFAFVIAGAVAVYGVIDLARAEQRELPAGSTGQDGVHDDPHPGVP